MRHIENQRATITNIVILIVSAILGFIVEKKFSPDLFPLSLLLVILGVYGAITTAKLYERHQFAQARLDHWYKHIDKLHPDAQILHLRDISDAEHRKQYPRIAKLRLHRLWIILHVAIALLGIVVTIVIL